MTLPRLKNIDDLIDLMEVLDDQELIDGHGFDMQREYVHREQTQKGCGSACCIGGWVQLCNAETRGLKITEAVQTIMDDKVSRAVIEHLCWPDDFDHYDMIKPSDAVEALKSIKKTGDFSWDDMIKPSDAVEALETIKKTGKFSWDDIV